MDGLIGRNDILETLEESFGTRSAFVVYGRLRIGKTALLGRFCEGKRSIRFVCMESSRNQNLRYFADVISWFTGEDAGPYDDFIGVEKDIAAICAEAPTVVILDEYQWLVESDGSVPSNIQRLIDLDLPGTESMIILCGSSIGAMRRAFRDGKGELYGRFKNAILLKPLTLAKCTAFHPGMPDMDLLLLYLTIGGIPAYHADHGGGSYRECVENSLTPEGWTWDEASAVIGMEPAAGRHASDILMSIGSGLTRQVDIAEDAGIDKSVCSKTMDALERIGLIGRVTPMLDSPRQPTYRITDIPLSFHFGVICRNRHIIESNPPDAAFEALEEAVHTHLGKVFEMFCENLVLRSYPVKEIGKWWRDDRRRGTHEEIGIVAWILEGGEEALLLAECCRIGRKAGFDEYRDLTRRARIAKAGEARLMMVSPSGFEDNFVGFAKREGVLLVGMDEIFGRVPMPSIEPPAESR